jgi:mitochondrial fission protein ELM1
MTKRNYKVWVLTDKFTGNAKQALSLAHVLFSEFLEIKLNYNFFEFIPNIIKGPSLLGLNKETKKQITKPFPDIIISSGRRTAAVAAFIKKKNPNTKIIQILWHELNNNLFDVVILPKHDKYQASNIIYIDGALTNISPRVLEDEKAQNPSLFTDFALNKIALLIGGDTKKGNLTEKHILELIAKVNTIALDTSSALLISTSRRTNPALIQTLKDNIKVPYFMYDVNQDTPNPYNAMLAYANIIITTGDSISMVTDACSSGKRVMIYQNPDFIGSKHYQFINSMFAQNYATDLLEYENWHDKNYALLNNFDKITPQITARLKL